MQIFGVERKEKIWAYVFLNGSLLSRGLVSEELPQVAALKYFPHRKIVILVGLISKDDFLQLCKLFGFLERRLESATKKWIKNGKKRGICNLLT